jgi:hypothetical protein
LENALHRAAVGLWRLCSETGHRHGDLLINREGLNTEPAAALVAQNDMRAMMKRQPGYLSETFLLNLNPGNSPRYVHVSRRTSMAYWAALFRTPEFSRLSAQGNERFTITASAFVPAE